MAQDPEDEPLDLDSLDTSHDFDVVPLYESLAIDAEAEADVIMGLPEGGHLRVISEGVRSLGSVLSVVAMRLGIEQWEVNPKALSRYREVEGQPRKDGDTDGPSQRRHMGARASRVLPKMRARRPRSGDSFGQVNSLRVLTEYQRRPVSVVRAVRC